MNGHIMNILSETEFAQANLAFSAKQANLKREGYGDIKHYPPIDENDIDKLYQSGVFDEDTPSGLQSKVWFELMYYICRRGRENLRKLEKDHFAIAEDSNGRRYVFQSKDEMTKKIRGDNTKSRVDAGRMYATEGDGCPVASFEKYISKLNPQNSALFQAPFKFVKGAQVGLEMRPWYKNAPVGEKTLGSFMSKLSLAAGLSRRYTNHSLRSTCITVLDEGGFDSRDICNVTGHRNEKSLRTYVGRPNDAKRQKLSDTLSTSIGYTAPRPTGSSSGNDKPSTSETENPSTSVSEIPVLPSEDKENDIVELNFPSSPILSGSQIDELSVMLQSSSNVSTNSQSHTSQTHVIQTQRQIQHMPEQTATPFTFNSCNNVTINYYQK